MKNDTLPPVAVTEGDFGKFLTDGCLICHEVNEFRFNGRDVKKEEVIKTECGHLYHSECLGKSISYRTGCPYCREGIPGTIDYLRQIMLDRLLRDAVKADDPEEAKRLISWFNHTTPDYTLLTVGFRKALDADQPEKARLWLALGALRDFSYLNARLQEAVDENEEAKTRWLMGLGALPDTPGTMNAILKYAADTNNPVLAYDIIRTADVEIMQTPVLMDILRAGLMKSAKECDPAKAVKWIRLGARGVDILNTGLLRSAVKNEPYLAKQWMNLGAVDSKALSTGLHRAAESDTPKYAKEWIAMGAEKDVTVLVSGYNHACPEHKLLWHRLDDGKDADILHARLNDAVDNNNPMLAQNVIKQLRTQGAEINGTVLERALKQAKGDSIRPGLTGIWKRIIDEETKRRERLSSYEHTVKYG